MTQLTGKKCEPCEGKTQPFNKEQIAEYLPQVPGWQVSDDGKMLTRDWNMKNFIAAVEFINNVAKIAESEQHHPDVHLTGYRKLRVVLSTHAIGGLSENDFILAAKLNEVPAQLKS
jgi:4a-hydroxytetrahydrobiopterin dehydratase